MKKPQSKNYWFKRRRYGYGWTPVTWQGWVALVALLAILVGGAIILLGDTPQGEFTSDVALYLVLVLAAIAAALLISYKKGPAPKWRWGKSDADKPDEDL